jgi:hypothetical protein
VFCLELLSHGALQDMGLDRDSIIRTWVTTSNSWETHDISTPRTDIKKTTGVVLLYRVPSLDPADCLGLEVHLRSQPNFSGAGLGATIPAVPNPRSPISRLPSFTTPIPSSPANPCPTNSHSSLPRLCFKTPSPPPSSSNTFHLPPLNALPLVPRSVRNPPPVTPHKSHPPPSPVVIDLTGDSDCVAATPPPTRFNLANTLPTGLPHPLWPYSFSFSRVAHGFDMMKRRASST